MAAAAATNNNNLCISPFHRVRTLPKQTLQFRGEFWARDDPGTSLCVRFPSLPIHSNGSLIFKESSRKLIWPSLGAPVVDCSIIQFGFSPSFLRASSSTSPLQPPTHVAFCNSPEWVFCQVHAMLVAGAAVFSSRPLILARLRTCNFPQRWFNLGFNWLILHLTGFILIKDRLGDIFAVKSTIFFKSFFYN